MISKFFLIIPAALLLAAAPAKSGTGAVEAETARIDTWAADPDARLVMITAMADDLKVHRNHLILLRKQTGKPYSEIYLSSLKDSGVAPEQLLERARALNREVARRLKEGAGAGEGENSKPVRPVASVATGVDHNSTDTFYWLLPEAGIDSAHASLVFGAPYFRGSGGAVAGMGDAYATGTVYGHAARLDLEGSLTLGFPTGDKNLGLGAGKLTADAGGTIARNFEHFRPFVSAGFANSTSNFAYFRPYLADGNAAHFSGGVDIRPASRVTVGFGAFALVPSGPQTVYSRIGTTSAATSQSGSQTPGNGMWGGGGGSINGTGAGPSMNGHGLEHMPFLATAQSTVSASEVADHGVSGWLSLLLARGVSLNVSAARSLPFELTTVQAGLSFDVARLLFQGKRHEGHSSVPGSTAR